MRSLVMAISLSALAAAPAAAAPVTVWFDPELPDPSVLERADNKTGGTAHVSVRTLLYPTTPEVPQDASNLEDLREAIANGLDRWDEFEVELPVAEDLGMTLDAVSLIRDREDLQVVFDALVFQGAAVMRAFEPDEFPEAQKAERWRAPGAPASVPRAWVDATALARGLGRDGLARQDFVDNNAWQDFQRVAGVLSALRPGTLTWDAVAGQLVVDGRLADDQDGEIELAAGRHFVHLLRDGVVCARARVDVLPGEVTPLPAAATPAEIALARERVGLSESRGLPDSVNAVLKAMEAMDGGPVCLAVAEGGRVAMAAYSPKCVLRDKQIFSAVLFGEVGGGVHVTELFEETADGKGPTAPAASVGGGVELGFSYFVLGLGVDGIITPGRTIEARGASSENTASAVHASPWGGVGAYILRPTADTPTLAVLGEVNWNGPAHLGFGGRLAVGIPIDARRNWFRISAGATYGPSTLWNLPEDPVPLITGWLRLGLAARL
jgi:hypothetical protein